MDEYVDVTVEPLPVSITASEIYAFHKLLVQDLDDLVRFLTLLHPKASG